MDPLSKVSSNVVAVTVTRKRVVRKDDTDALRAKVRSLTAQLRRVRQQRNSAIEKSNKLLLELRTKVKGDAILKQLSLLPKKQQLVVKMMLMKTKVKQGTGMRYDAEYLLEMLLLKMKSCKAYHVLVTRDLLPMPSESTLNKLVRTIKCSDKCNNEVLQSVKDALMEFKDEKNLDGFDVTLTGSSVDTDDLSCNRTI